MERAERLKQICARALTPQVEASLTGAIENYVAQMESFDQGSFDQLLSELERT